MGMSESNKERFNDLIAKIMTTLIDTCPVYTPLSASEFGFEVGTTIAPSGYYEPTPDEAFFNSCVQWLRDEEFIRGKNEYVATSYGLEVFNSLPECLKNA
jgi:hypothetical protein